MGGTSPRGSLKVMRVEDAPPTKNTLSTSTSIPRPFSVALTAASVSFARTVAQPLPPKATFIFPSRARLVPSRRVATDTVPPVSDDVVVKGATSPGRDTKVTLHWLVSSRCTFTRPRPGNLPMATSKSVGEASCGMGSDAVLACTNLNVPPDAPDTVTTWTSCTAPCSMVVIVADPVVRISPVFPSVSLNESHIVLGARSSTRTFRPRSWCSTRDNNTVLISSFKGRVVRPFNVNVKLPRPVTSSCWTS
mmetsp:Transcript_8395/g.23763  ORF Transcript_8395/g.23763 Transcript_8395/m.23763 type:complete len:249 (+) Transcript_8395:15155-15901(+)